MSRSWRTSSRWSTLSRSLVSGAAGGSVGPYKYTDRFFGERLVDEHLVPRGLHARHRREAAPAPPERIEHEGEDEPEQGADEEPVGDDGEERCAVVGEQDAEYEPEEHSPYGSRQEAAQC